MLAHIFASLAITFYIIMDTIAILFIWFTIFLTTVFSLTYIIISLLLLFDDSTLEQNPEILSDDVVMVTVVTVNC